MRILPRSPWLFIPYVSFLSAVTPCALRSEETALEKIVLKVDGYLT